MKKCVKIATAHPAKLIQLPVSDTSVPFGAAKRDILPIDLKKFGYKEEEYLITGTANVYTWPQSEYYPDIRTPSVPYTSRILVRKPHPADFSGNVWIELFNWAASYDRPVAGWGQCAQYFIDSKDIWIGVTVRDVCINSLKRFDPVRYKDISFKNPLSKSERKPRIDSYNETDPEQENGLCYDMISQLVAAVKGGSGPFKNYDIRAVLATAATGGDLSAYAAAIHPITSLENGDSTFDGYMIHMTGAPGALNSEEAKLDALDPRCKIRLEVPIIRTYTTGDILGGGFHPDWSCMQRRPDSDELGNQYRTYEFGGTCSVSLHNRLSGPCFDDVEKAGGNWRGVSPDELLEKGTAEFPLGYFLAAAFENLKKWVRLGITPPHADFLKLEGEYPDMKFVIDKYGNPVGGVRSPYIDVPTCTYTPAGEAKPFSEQLLKDLYIDNENYIRNFILSTLKTYVNGFLTEAGAMQLILDVINSTII